MEELNCSRKLDTMGRIMIPKHLREQYDFKIGCDYQFYLHDEGESRYLCIKIPAPPDEKLIQAMDLLEAAGYEVTPGEY